MTEPILRLCIVCAGNICRSPIAEVVLRHHLESVGLGGRVAVESAGTGDWHIGDPADRRALDVLKRHGYDASTHRARQFRTDWFERADLVLATDRDNFARLHGIAPDSDASAKIQLLRVYDPDAVTDEDIDVPDPYFGDVTSFELVLGMAERASAGLIDAIRREFIMTSESDGGEPGRH